ncbi:MAG: Gfo/Idh/MocA family oxidoreductase [Gemmataceae bacterium]|nr:Gfo/Idh/MocA family oxidoreductase [Gemmataceae bacterium]
MIRLGVLDFDTSHVAAFTTRLNRKGVPETQWVDGATVVVGCPGESKIAPERIPGYKAEMEKLGVPLVEKPTDMIGKVDGMLVCSLEGGAHLERARPFLEKGIPCFIDKPFTCSVADARKIADLAKKHKTAVFSSSSLRYAPEVVAYAADAKRGKLLGVVTHGPAHLHEQKGDTLRNPGLYHYGIHPAEVLYALMGPGCVRVACTQEKDADVTTGQWKDGRLATLRGLRSGAQEYGFLAFAQKEVKHVKIGTSVIYRELLKQIVEFMKTKKSPVPIEETIELMGFVEAAHKSAANHGAGEKVG